MPLPVRRAATRASAAVEPQNSTPTRPMPTSAPSAPSTPTIAPATPTTGTAVTSRASVAPRRRASSSPVSGSDIGATSAVTTRPILGCGLGDGGTLVGVHALRAEPDQVDPGGVAEEGPDHQEHRTRAQSPVEQPADTRPHQDGREQVALHQVGLVHAAEHPPGMVPDA